MTGLGKNDYRIADGRHEAFGLMEIDIMARESMKNHERLNSRLGNPGWLRPICILAAILVLAPAPALAANKNAKGQVLGPTGLRGFLNPKWPHKAVEFKVTYIEEGSPSSGTELKAGDVIVGFGNEKFREHPLWAMAKAIEVA